MDIAGAGHDLHHDNDNDREAGPQGVRTHRDPGRRVRDVIEGAREVREEVGMTIIGGTIENLVVKDVGSMLAISLMM